VLKRNPPWFLNQGSSLFEGPGAGDLRPRPVLKDDVVMEERGYFIYVVLVPGLVPSGQRINDLPFCQHCQTPFREISL